jgi:hypothetical protein
MPKSNLDRRIRKLEVDRLRQELSRGPAISYKQLLLERCKRIRDRMDAAGERPEELSPAESERLLEFMHARLSDRRHKPKQCRA